MEYQIDDDGDKQDDDVDILKMIVALFMSWRW